MDIELIPRTCESVGCFSAPDVQVEKKTVFGRDKFGAPIRSLTIKYLCESCWACNLCGGRCYSLKTGELLEKLSPSDILIEWEIKRRLNPSDNLIPNRV